VIYHFLGCRNTYNMMTFIWMSAGKNLIEDVKDL
jgi:hypothetical protein